VRRPVERETQPHDLHTLFRPGAYRLEEESAELVGIFWELIGVDHAAAEGV
jgi:hypothetical protein